MSGETAHEMYKQHERGQHIDIGALYFEDCQHSNRFVSLRVSLEQPGTMAF